MLYFNENYRYLFMDFGYIRNNLLEVKQKIKSACVNSKRDINDVKLIAVSKTFPSEAISASCDFGQIDFGENKVQEMVKKNEDLAGKNINWHLIGHLQTNKVKYIVPFVHLIHSVDSIKLAEKINSEALKIGRIIDCMIQVNTSNEEQKSGCEPSETISIVKEISGFANVRIKGLMTIGKIMMDENDEDELKEVRRNFTLLRDIFHEVDSLKIDNIEMKYLSMGMTADFDIAIEEGANMLRIGSAVFGHRNYQKV
ncbi:MAG: YggS family pyridoxal phosphate-dependent enzyme [Ignavibacteriae bacterium]|nr:MAG: YggS family pyridoxal phosphate-dependent enzyme [Ignavibacteriota bacterium]